jgi:acyl phosphate:glycerol-3-phosphate acyltransferase
LIFFFIFLEFICGSLMFSYWIGLKVHKNITKIGDGNPGAFNLWSAAGFKLGILGVFLDFIKGYFPLVLLIESGYIKEIYIIPVALAPILGHAFSPFMKLKGGKAVAVTFGVWSALTRFEVSLAYAITLAIEKLIVKKLNHGRPTTTEIDALMGILGMLIIMLYLVARNFSDYLLVLWIINILILAYKSKEKLYKLLKNKAGTTETF